MVSDMAVRSRRSASRTGADEKVHGSRPRDQRTQVQTKRYPCSRRCILALFGCLLVMVYVIVPCALRFSQRLQSALVYYNFLNAPFFVNLSNPSELGLENARHFFLRHEGNGCKIGVWQVLPVSYGHVASLDEKESASLLSDGKPIVLYLHGNTGNRALSSRVGVYDFLAKEVGVHVVTFDYRGFGDSDCFPGEENMKEDGLLIWDWIRLHAPDARVYLWGHSLGSAAATNLAQHLTQAGTPPSGLLLDAPFTTIVEAGSSHPSGFMYWLAPISHLFRQLVLEHFFEKHTSIDRLPHITCPILIVHGDNDIVIPIQLGREMYQAALSSRRPDSGVVEFIECEGASHKYNHLCPRFKDSAKKFFH